MPLNLPQKQFNIKKSGDGRLRIFDRLRRKFVALTPEEWAPIIQYGMDFASSVCMSMDNYISPDFAARYAPGNSPNSL